MKTNNRKTKAELRAIAIGAVRSEIRSQGRDPESVFALDAYDILDGMCQDPQHKDKLFKIWWEAATDNQYQLFLREWRKR